MEHYCVRCHGRPIYGVFARVYEYTRSVIVATHGLAIAAHAMYHDNPDNPEISRAICQFSADMLNAWLRDHLPACKDQYDILAHARDTFQQVPDHNDLALLESSLAEYLASDLVSEDEE